MKTTHTPGPWKMTHGSTAFVVKADNRLIATAWADKRKDVTVKELPAEANARLIAAAPDLLAALEMALGEFHAQAQKPDASALLKATDHICAALAKAKG